MTTLSDILQDVLIYLGDFKEGRATGGSTSTIVDSTLAGTDNDYTGGTAFVTYDAGGVAAAPENEFALVTGYTSGTGTITSAASSYTAAPVAGDYYGVSTKEWPLYKLITLVNSGLQGIGDIELVDTTTLDTASNQTEYQCELVWKRSGPKKIDIQGITTDANDNRWFEVPRGKWEYIPATAGSTGLIVMPQYPSGRGVRIWYKDKHPAVRVYSSVIYEAIHPEWLVWETVYRALRWRKGMQDAPSGIEDMLREADQRRQEYGFLHKPIETRRKGRLFYVGKQESEDKFTYPGPP